MTQTASGMFCRMFPDTISAVFILNNDDGDEYDTQYTFNATVRIRAPSPTHQPRSRLSWYLQANIQKHIQRLEPFSSRNATLRYNNENELTSTRSFRGRIGEETFRLELGNGVIVEGRLDAPGLEEVVEVFGSGTWRQY